MDITALRGMTREEQLKAADAYAGVAPGVLAGIWKAETNQGQHPTMIGPKTKWGTAKGHFQILDNVHSTIEGRRGTKLDRFDFTEALVTAADILKENRAAYSTDADAIRAYHGGRKQKNWGEKTEAYVTSVLGGAQPAAQPKLSGKGKLPKGAHIGEDGEVTVQPRSFDQFFRGDNGVPPVSAGDIAAIDADSSTYRQTIPVAPQGSNVVAQAGAATAREAQEAEQQKAQDQSFFGLNDRNSTLGAAYSRTLTPLFNAVAHVVGNDTSADAAYLTDLAANPALALGTVPNPTPEEAQLLLGTTSRDDLTLARGKILTQREDQTVLGRAGTASEMTAMLMAGALDPTTYATGFGAAKAFHMAGYGATALAAAGRPTAAAASVFAENVVGNVAYDAVQNMLGEHKSAADYGLSAVTGLIPGMIQAPFTLRAAQHSLETRLAREAYDKQRPYLERAQAELGPDADPAAVSARASKYEAEEVAADRTRRLSTPPAEDRIDAPDLDALAAEAPATPAAYNGLESRSFNPDTKLGSDLALESNITKYGITRNADEVRGLLAGTHLDAATANSPQFKEVAGIVETLRKKYVPDMALHIQRGSATSGADASLSLGPNRHAIFLTAGEQAQPTAIHELGHVIFENYASKLPEPLRAKMVADWQAWKTDFESGGGRSNAQARLGLARATSDTAMGRVLRGEETGAFKDVLTKTLQESGRDAQAYMQYFTKLDEFAAEQFVKKVEADLAAGKLKQEAGLFTQLRTLISKMLDFWRDAKASGALKPTDSFEEFFEAAGARALDQGVASGELQRMALPADPLQTKYGLDTLAASDPRERMEQKYLTKVLRDAEAWVAANPQDPERLKTIMNNSLFNMASPGMVLANSKHPVAKMVSGLMVENTQGASGRKVTAAIRKAQYEREFVGNALIKYDSAYEQWRNGKVGRMRGEQNDLMAGGLRDEFNRAVSTEIEGRLWKRPVTTDPLVKQAADELEVSYERMRLAQTDTKTVGWGALPHTSVGYMPHKTDAAKFLSLGPEETRAYRGALKQQLMDIDGMDDAFADKVAGMYLDHARVNANGGHEIPASIHDPSAADYVRQALQASGLTKAEIDQFANKLAAGGASHTKQRLKLDLTAPYTRADGSTFTLMDLFVTDHATLLRNQSRRVAGEVAMAQQGIMGSGGLRLLERSMQFWPEGASPKERAATMEAFQQVSAEMLGRPYGEATPTWLEGMLTANSASNLGGMGFTQLGEYINVATGVGINGALKAVGSFPRLMGEVRALAKGQKVQNSWLSSMELPGGGGEFGLTGYKMITKYDSPSAVYDSVGRDSLTTVDRLIRRVGHGLGKLSMHRMIQAVQVRGTAEQITQKAIKYIRDGKESKALLDMGFGPDLQQRIKAEIPNIATFDGAGNISGLDMRKAVDTQAASDFISAVHRGAGQLIQESYVGEIGKWQHSNMGKVLTQFRSFPITAMEKQWGRNRSMHGVPIAMGMILAAVPFAVPIVLARVALNATGRPDAEAYIEKQTSPVALARATMNYIGMLGLAPDLVDAFAAPMPEEWKQALGDTNRVNRTPTTGGIIPLVGYADNWLKAANNLDNPHYLGRALPFSNTPWFTPLVNMLRPDAQ